MASMANLHQSKFIYVVRRSGCDKAVGTSDSERRSAWVEGYLCDSNLLLGPWNGFFQLLLPPFGRLSALLAPALPEMETLWAPFAPRIFIELANQQQLSQGSSWHNRQGSKAWAAKAAGQWVRGSCPLHGTAGTDPACSQQPGPCSVPGVLPWWCTREDAAGVSHLGLQHQHKNGCIYRRQIRFFH